VGLLMGEVSGNWTNTAAKKNMKPSKR
jgi:hypothetical protein